MSVFYTGSYLPAGKPGIKGYSLSDEGIPELITDCREVENPSYLCVDKDNKYLYSVSELEEGGKIYSFKINPDFSLSYISSHDTLGSGACHISLDGTGKYLAVSSYYSGDFELFGLSGGNITGRVYSERYSSSSVVPERQDSAHAHSAAFIEDNTEIAVCDLGGDTINIYSFSASPFSIDKKAVIKTRPGSGPRHILQIEKGLFYVISEISFDLFTVKVAGDSYEILNKTSAVPADCEYTGGAAAIRYRRDANALYISNRMITPPDTDCIAVIPLSPDGIPDEDKKEFYKCGRFPRDINLHNGFLTVGLQNDDRLEIRREREVIYSTESEKISCISDLI